MIVLNALGKEEFYHEVFDESNPRQHIQKETELFGDIRNTIGIWRKPIDELAISIQYEIKNLAKMMP